MNFFEVHLNFIEKRLEKASSSLFPRAFHHVFATYNRNITTENVVPLVLFCRSKPLLMQAAAFNIPAPLPVTDDNKYGS